MKIAKIHRRPSPPPFDPAVSIARKYRLSISHARVVAELAGIGGKDAQASNCGGAK